MTRDPALLPEALRMLPRFQAVTPGNGDWDVTMALLIREIEAVLRRSGPAPRAASPAPRPS